jgi:hypothetical protein
MTKSHHQMMMNGARISESDGTFPMHQAARWRYAYFANYTPLINYFPGNVCYVLALGHDWLTGVPTGYLVYYQYNSN